MMKSCEDFFEEYKYCQDKILVFFMTFPIYLLLLNVKLIWSFCMHTFFTSLYNEVSEIFNEKNSVFSFNPRCRK
ncbi:hypothetical protein CN558_18590 [Bacillus wiedmannii]|uniref:Uncharacterized protein n=1 Tax=Bacillus wiedmannii TaxID=1890302 RepID=A0A2B6UD93_9BACI|nr:hypothetical protein CN690_20125 [Bacillus wiedmannii]PEK62205.1 hypothetical protein CN595_09935 [Bacillus wiedmannii]PEL84082.1 hypothetical protein CN609_05540 [Bacillus wiedmannii]PEM27265.1 hypothetical protein CN598_21070 [Bacillus wiedmannii]PEM82673.1 hypothetical protein CN627_25840 [Bacillus wiedmannii]